MRTLGAVVLLAVLAASGCGPEGGRGVNLCGLVSREDAGAALGSPTLSATAEPVTGAAVAQCIWLADNPSGPRQRMLSATLWRAHAGGIEASAQQLFTEELQAMESEYGETRIIDGLGEAAVMGFGEITDFGIEGGLVARKGKHVLVLRYDGQDPAGFEEIARKILARL